MCQNDPITIVHLNSTTGVCFWALIHDHVFLLALQANQFGQLSVQNLRPLVGKRLAVQVSRSVREKASLSPSSPWFHTFSAVFSLIPLLCLSAGAICNFHQAYSPLDAPILVRVLSKRNCLIKLMVSVHLQSDISCHAGAERTNLTAGCSLCGLFRRSSLAQTREMWGATTVCLHRS